LQLQTRQGHFPQSSALAKVDYESTVTQRKCFALMTNGPIENAIGSIQLLRRFLKQLLHFPQKKTGAHVG
jgi:hypothetical protein